MRHPWKEKAECEAGKRYLAAQPKTREQEAQNLSRLTGWDIETIRERAAAIVEGEATQGAVVRISGVRRGSFLLERGTVGKNRHSARARAGAGRPLFFGTMNETPNAEPTADFVGRPVGMWLGAALVAALAVVAALALSDSARRANLEDTAELTAVGDAVFFPMPASPSKTYPLTVKLAGQPLFPVSAKAVRMDDSEVRRVAKDKATGLTVYQAGPNVPKTEEEHARKAERFYFLKLAPGQFLKASTSTPATGKH
jgi:hypothetical protein